MRTAKKAMGLPKDGAGTAFYRFEHVPSAKEFKNNYRKLLDETKVDEKLADLIVAEANLAFVLNMRVFEELDVMSVEADKVRPLQDVLATLEMPVKENQKCPFANMGGPNPHAVVDALSGKKGGKLADGAKCPFPFILLHDPKEGMKDPRAWLVFAVLPFLFLILSRLFALSM